MTSVGTTVPVGIDDQRLDLLVIPLVTAQAIVHQVLALATDGQVSTEQSHLPSGSEGPSA
jgi:hypothetical protein